MRCSLVLLALLSACGQSKEGRARDDAAAIAAVKAAQNQLPPIRLIVPEALLPDDLGRIDASGGRCSLVLPSGAAPVLVTMGSYGWIKLDSELIKLAADIGSDHGPVRTWSHYVGKQITLRVEPADTDTAPGSGPVRHRVKLVVRDAWDRIVFAADGAQACQA